MHLVIRLSKCVTMAGPDWGPTSGWLYDFRAQNGARVTQILGFEGV